MVPEVPIALGHVRALWARKHLGVEAHLSGSLSQVVLTLVVVQGPSFPYKDYKTKGRYDMCNQ